MMEALWMVYSLWMTVIEKISVAEGRFRRKLNFYLSTAIRMF